MSIEIIMLIFMICVISFIIYYFVDLAPNVIKDLENSSCETLLERIQSDFIPNYQFDLREWVSKECWK